ncbi:MAG: hypothetical protein ACETVR_03970 [Candidatus Bathyarchaeia archaeon]
MSRVKLCFPKCEEFRCSKRALRIQGGGAWCTWTNEPCNPTNCTYALCMRRRLLSNGVCASSIKRRTREEEQPEDLLKEEIKVRSKLLRKVGEKRILR